MSKIKTISIFLLSGLAIYLASQLWFVNTSSRNFFYTFFSRTGPQDVNDDRVFVQPYRLVLNYGSNKFEIEYSGMGVNKLRESCDSCLQSMLKDGEYLGKRDLNYSEVFGAEGYIYEYAFNMPTSVFALAFNKNSFADPLKYITSIVFIPPDAKRSTTIVWLLDEADMQMTGYSVSSALPPITANPDDSTQEVIYESSALSADDFADKNIFIAKKRKEDYKYPSVSIVNPYADNELLMGAIEKNINTFFENPAAKLEYMGDYNVYTFVDADTVVKYYQNDVLEYSNYLTGSIETNLLKSFGTALSFIKSDKLIVNEYYLADFAQEDNEYTFYFDYVVNNFPMILPDEYKRDDKENGAATLNHSIEVTVREGNVVNYKKIVYNFITDTASKTAKLDFDQVLDEVKASQNEGQSKIANVILGYKLERSKKAYLYWIINLGGPSLSKIG